MKKLRETLYRQIKWLEFAIGFVMALSLIWMAVRMGADIWELSKTETTEVVFTRMLANAFQLVIGVEFVKMILRPTSENVLEVVMLTIARVLIMDHSKILNCLLGVLSMAVIFIVRKYFFCEITTEPGKPDKRPDKLPSAAPERAGERETADVS